MIEAVYLENYKCYGPNGAKFDLKPLTFLYGTNGVGKSTFIEAVLQLKEWEQKRIKPGKLWLSADFVFKKNETLPVGIGVALSTNSGNIKLFKRVCFKDGEGIIESDKIDPVMNDSQREGALADFMKMRHMSASRPESKIAKSNQTSSLADLQQPDEARMDGVKAVNNSDEINRMLAQVGFSDYEFINREELRDKLYDVTIPWKNTGAGVHNNAFTLDAIASLQPNGILLLEEPETHMDPRYLGAFARVLVDAIHVKTGAQIIVECHSEHLMLAIKGLIRTKAMKADEVTALHVGRSPEGSVVTHIPLAEDGTFDREWPDGGFYLERRELIMMGEDKMFGVSES